MISRGASPPAIEEPRPRLTLHRWGVCARVQTLVWVAWVVGSFTHFPAGEAEDQIGQESLTKTSLLTQFITFLRNM